MKRWLWIVITGWVAAGWGYPGVFVEGSAVPRIVFPELIGGSGIGSFLAYPGWVDWSRGWEVSGGAVWLPLDRRSVEVGGWLHHDDWGGGVGWVWHEIGAIPLRDVQGNVVGETRVGTHIGGVSIQHRIHPQLSAGASLLGIYRNLWADRGWGIALGMGGTGVWKAWTVYGGIRRILGRIQWHAGYQENLSPVVEGGMMWSHEKIRVGFHGAWTPNGGDEGLFVVWHPASALSLGGGWSSQEGWMGGMNVGFPSFRILVGVFQDPVSKGISSAFSLLWSGKVWRRRPDHPETPASTVPTPPGPEKNPQTSRRDCSQSESYWEFLECVQKNSNH